MLLRLGQWACPHENVLLDVSEVGPVSNLYLGSQGRGVWIHTGSVLDQQWLLGFDNGGGSPEILCLCLDQEIKALVAPHFI